MRRLLDTAGKSLPKIAALGLAGALSLFLTVPASAQSRDAASASAGSGIAKPEVLPNETSRRRFQRQVRLTCSAGFCQATFFTVPAKTYYELDFASCYARVPSNGVVYEVYLQRSNNGDPFYQDLALAWQTNQGTTNLYSFEKETRLFAHPGTTLRAVITASAALGFNYCNIFGEIATVQ